MRQVYAALWLHNFKQYVSIFMLGLNVYALENIKIMVQL